MEPAPEQENETANDEQATPDSDELTGDPGDDAPWWGRGKPPHPYDISERREAFIEATLVPFDEDTRRFFRHVLVSFFEALKTSRNPSYGRTERDREERSQGYAPIDSKFIEKYFRQANWRALRDAGLIDVLPYSREEKLAYRYRPAPAFVEEFRRAGMPESAEEAELIAKEGRVNVTSGEKARGTVKTHYTDENGRRYPPLIDAGLRAMEECPIVYGAKESEGILHHLHLRYRQLLDTGWKPSDGVPHPKWEPEGSRAYHRYANDERCAAALLVQGFRHVRDGLAIYKPAYRIASSGRTAQAGGGLQSCSGEMKGAAYLGLSAYGYDVRNYDMVAAHPSLYTDLAREAGLAADWMEGYLAKPHVRQFYADALMLETSDWKWLTLAVLMAGYVPQPEEVAEPSNWYRLRNVTVVKIIDDVVWARMEKEGLLQRVGGTGKKRMSLTKRSKKGYWQARYEYYNRFYLFTRDMRQGIDQWLDHLIMVGVKQGRSSNFDGLTYVTNKAGLKKGFGEVPENPVERQHLASELAAFILQGAEAATIHALASLGEKYGFSPVANEHDGLITLGPVPEAAVREAAEMAGVDPAAVTLEEKPFKEPLA